MSAANLEDEVLLASAQWNDIETLAGREFRGQWLHLDPERLIDFDRAALIDDNDHGFASIYPEGLIEGFHQLALLDHLVNAVLFIEDPRWSGWNYGFDFVRFTSVVTTSDPIRVSGSVHSVTSRGDGAYLVELRCTIEVAGRAKPSCVVHWKVMWVLADEEALDA